MRLTKLAALLIVSVWLPVTAGLAQTSTVSPKVNPLREAYYGDLHLHTSYSFDAYIGGGTVVDPDVAYRFARGEVVQYLGQSMRRRESLDFLAVTDHAENIGVANELDDPDSLVSRSAFGKSLATAVVSATLPSGVRDENKLWAQWVQEYQMGGRNPLPAELRSVSTSAWQHEIDLANRNYRPGEFTTFVAYEWTSGGSGERTGNLHRNVIFKGNSAPYPFTAFDSKSPEDLWAWLERIRKEGYEALAIPHSANFSNGFMYDWVDSRGKAIDAVYAGERQANEPLSQILSITGSDEIHPLLAPSDEFASFDIMVPVGGREAGSYLRDALGRGLVLERTIGANPFKYGFVGGSDLHTGLSVSAQADYVGQLSRIVNPTRDQVAGVLGLKKSDVPFQSLLIWSTSGSLTGVWAESNTRESIYNALRRKETFATSGTRLKFRFFGSWGFKDGLLEGRGWVQTAYRLGVPMGGDLPAPSDGTKAPSFAIWAVKDPNGANLDRAQLIKVWEEGGEQRAKVFDVAWSGGRRPDPKTGKLPAVGNTVDVRTGEYANTIGAVRLQAVWKDPAFDPKHHAAYYLRVLEIPTPRWSTLLALGHGLPVPKNVPPTEQQRGWSSPIWYSPPAK